MLETDNSRPSRVYAAIQLSCPCPARWGTGTIDFLTVTCVTYDSNSNPRWNPPEAPAA